MKGNNREKIVKNLLSSHSLSHFPSVLPLKLANYFEN